MKRERSDNEILICSVMISVGISTVVGVLRQADLRLRTEALERRLPAPTTPTPDQAAERDRGYAPTVTERIERIGK